MAYQPSQLRMSSKRTSKTSNSESYKRRRDDDDDNDCDPSSTRRRRISGPPDYAEAVMSTNSTELPDAPSSPLSPVPYPLPDDSSVSSDGKAAPTPSSLLDDERDPVSDEQVYEYHRKGTEYQEWIADPTLGGCRCGRARKSLVDLLNNENKNERLHCPENHFDNPPFSIIDDLEPLGFPTRNYKFRYTKLLLHGYDKDGYKRESEYQNTFAEGVIIGESIFRYTGPHWSDIAIAQYKFDHPIDTLKYLYFTNVQNNQTLPYVQEILYPRHDVDWPRGNEIERQVWEYDTDEYKEILGTKLGKAAACLVIGAWERGTHRIARIHTLGREYKIHLRFDIEPLPTTSTT
ncbi:uncharacterized protein N7500_008591 [Penicillium coprophilum]|uniref:uncharacterized protein n=1 Tax=Penicillium coprophilum TaxID=36646 RepID=UPI0023958BAF|nr:uncharacterized protein N7500_008591 [Penicillium coprophilum]KAJ5158940.1 hypothetical protein N7500_008591 [Penicillium coprophilum]